MLSPHEMATLMLIKDTSDETELDRADLDALLEHQFVSLERLDSGRQHPCITARGGALLNAIARIR
ncbi:hypothetical protein [Cupriavidus basilensis]|uniref:hypothetical protein n=1 Tax=Cupriavidus basilensis TaxID=68895 RepID=UPI0039F724C2